MKHGVYDLYLNSLKIALLALTFHTIHHCRFGATRQNPSTLLSSNFTCLSLFCNMEFQALASKRIPSNFFLRLFVFVFVFSFFSFVTTYPFHFPFPLFCFTNYR
ncbi:uncharacterized protein SOCG_04968 [Schizosaccharomyces octosporus yFS286]|uniref:Uncharacterized protein n=1 Tax=Schizosaccharomyces octosporus (strain yFS286) TaxID=483514 RepID=S9R5I2_SCHOY|nr:uncharacterized protein SOCG_04968 [Schizosaccharomyces octosporus yFS286]EPX73570.1 hypothetical protein SOCG_04968 [Schizosaccharomyces octosporus yFS286]